MKNWAPMKTTANDSWIANCGRNPISPTAASTIPCIEFIRTRTVRMPNKRTARPRFFSKKYALAVAMLRTRVTIDPPRGRFLGSAEFGDGSVVEMNDEVEGEAGPIAPHRADEDLGHAVRPLRVGPHRLGAPDG